MLQKIGNVNIDDTFYPGKDLYSDGVIEDEILEIVKNNPKERYREIIEERASWPIFYHLSEFRHNIVEWLPIGKNDKVLEVGSGCGAITGALAAKAKEVTCIELSMKRTMINATRNSECGNVNIHVGNFKDVESTLPCDYDYVMLIGVFEYGYGYMGTNTPYEDFAKILKKHLRPQGRMVIAIENKFGMKYFAGCREDHSGTFFDGIEDYPKGDGTARTFSRKGLAKILEASGITEFQFYYPYPDYKFPTTIFSDNRLPKVGELYQNIRNFDRDRMLLFDEQRAFDSVIREEMFPHYSNSFMVITGPELSTEYVKYSNDRDEKYAVRTKIENEAGERLVEKYALHDEAIEHVAALAKNYEAYSDKRKIEQFEYNVCLTSFADAQKSGCVKFEYVDGKTLEEYLDDYVLAGDEKQFKSLFTRYCEIVDAMRGEPLNYDFIFQNILMHDGVWTAIDYEWSFPRVVKRDVLIARAMHCYLADRAFRQKAKEWMLSIVSKYGSDLMEYYKYMPNYEVGFQDLVKGPHLALSELRHQIGNPAFSLDYICERIGAGAPSIQIYEDTGAGYSEEQSYFIEQYTREGQDVLFSIPLRKELNAVRIDPAVKPCFVSVVSVKCDEKDVFSTVHTKKNNGALLAKGKYVFATTDPHFEWKVKDLCRHDKATLQVRLKLEYMSLEAASSVCEAMGLRGRLPW